MDLIWLKYKNRKKQLKHSLFLYLGVRGGKLHLLKASFLAPKEIASVRRSIEKLQILPLEGKMTWLRDNVPIGFSKAYRTMRQENIHVIRKYKAGSI